MNTSHAHSHTTPDLPEPKREEIGQTKKLVKDKYGITVPEADVVRLVTLIKELDWWEKVGAKPTSIHSFTDEQLTDLKEFLEEAGGEFVSQTNIREQAQTLLTVVPLKERQRITDEIRGILVEHKPVPYESTVVEKMKKLLSLQYDLTLSDDQLDQLIPFLAKTLWYHEGLDSSLEQCLDDLILFLDRVRRGKRTHGLLSHDALRKNLDEAVLKLTSKEYAQFFTEFKSKDD